MRTIIEGGYVATVDPSGTEHTTGHVVVDDGVISAVGAGPASDDVRAGADIVDATGCLVTPGLVNTHHHLYQWLTRGYAQDAILFDWLTALYPLWSRIDAGLTGAGAGGRDGGARALGLHHGRRPPLRLPAGLRRHRRRRSSNAPPDVGVRLHATRGSMDLGASQGGLPPDFAVETTDAALAASQRGRRAVPRRLLRLDGARRDRARARRSR